MEGVEQPLTDLTVRSCADCNTEITQGYVHKVGTVGEAVSVVVVCRECNVKRRRAQ